MRIAIATSITSAAGGLFYTAPIFRVIDVPMVDGDGAACGDGLRLSAAIQGRRQTPFLPAPHGGPMLREREVTEIYLPAMEMSLGALLVGVKTQKAAVSTMLGVVDTFVENGWQRGHPLGGDYARELLPSHRVLEYLGLEAPRGCNLAKVDRDHDALAITSKDKLSELAGKGGSILELIHDEGERLFDQKAAQ